MQIEIVVDLTNIPCCYCLNYCNTGILFKIIKPNELQKLYCKTCFDIVLNQQSKITDAITPLLNIKCWVFIRYERSEFCVSDFDLQNKLTLIDKFIIKQYGTKNAAKLLSEEFLDYCYSHLNETVPHNLLLKFAGI
jgi:hypothetical protein